MELKRTGLTFIKRADWDPVPTPAIVTCLFTCLYFKTQGQLPIPWDPAPPGNIRCFHSMMAVKLWWEELHFGGKDQLIIWELVISSPEKTFFSINDFRSAICSHKALWAIFLLYCHQICEGTSKAKLAKVGYFQEAGTFVLSQERHLTK